MANKIYVSYLNSLERLRRFRVFLAENVPHVDGRRSLQPAFALMIPEVSMSGKEEMKMLTLPPLSATSSVLPLLLSPLFFAEDLSPFAIDVGHGKRCASFGVSQQVPPRQSKKGPVVHTTSNQI